MGGRLNFHEDGICAQVKDSPRGWVMFEGMMVQEVVKMMLQENRLSQMLCDVEVR